MRDRCQQIWCDAHTPFHAHRLWNTSTEPRKTEIWSNLESHSQSAEIPHHSISVPGIHCQYVCCCPFLLLGGVMVSLTFRSSFSPGSWSLWTGCLHSSPLLLFVTSLSNQSIARRCISIRFHQCQTWWAAGFNTKPWSLLAFRLKSWPKRAKLFRSWSWANLSMGLCIPW